MSGSLLFVEDDLSVEEATSLLLERAGQHQIEHHDIEVPVGEHLECLPAVGHTPGRTTT